MKSLRSNRFFLSFRYCSTFCSACRIVRKAAETTYASHATAGLNRLCCAMSKAPEEKLGKAGSEFMQVGQQQTPAARNQLIIDYILFIQRSRGERMIIIVECLRQDDNQLFSIVVLNINCSNSIALGVESLMFLSAQSQVIKLVGEMLWHSPIIVRLTTLFLVWATLKSTRHR